MVTDKKCRWVSIKERNPTESKFYIVLRGRFGGHHPSGCYPAMHFYDVDIKEWSSETKYWLEENID